ncbi:MAG: hypothetical protein PHR25_03550, partial [Clostridia bacterium]|nr:hypothetical protein [Clostridia bacterium]
MKKKYIIYMSISFLIVLLVITILIVNSKNDRISDNAQTKIVNNKATSDVSIEEIQFKNISKAYNSGITTIKATIYNTTDTVKNIKIKIILKDKNGTEVVNMMQ